MNSHSRHRRQAQVARPQDHTDDPEPRLHPSNSSPKESSRLLFVTAPLLAQPGPSSGTEVPAMTDQFSDYVALPMENSEEARENGESGERRGRVSWLTVLMLPGRLAVGALSFLAGTGISKRSGLSRGAVLFSGCVSVVLGQFFVSAALRHARRRWEEEGARAEQAREERMAWLDAIQAVGKIVETFSDGLRGPHAMKHMFLDTSLIRLLHDSTTRNSLRAATSKPYSPTDALLLGRYYLDYALATYGFMLLKLLGVMDPTYNVMVEGTRGVDVAQYMLRLSRNQILVSMLDGEGINVPRHFVALDDSQKSVVVAIRGTNSISDIITDLLCGNEPFAGGYAHCGMKDAAEALYSAILPTLRSALSEHPSYSIALTGHSLGAGVAILLTKVLLMNGFTDVKCYAIAPCPVFGPMHRVDSDWSDALECFVHADDLVARLCLASARNLALEIERVDSLTLSVTDKKEIINTQNGEHLERILRRDRQVTRDPREQCVEQLYIPTHHGIHWLIPDEHDGRENGEGRSLIQDRTEDCVGPAYVPSKAYSSFVVRPRLFERMVVTSGCVNAHFPNSYTSAFAALDLPPREIRAPPLSKPDFSKVWYANELG